MATEIKQNADAIMYNGEQFLLSELGKTWDWVIEDGLKKPKKRYPDKPKAFIVPGDDQQIDTVERTDAIAEAEPENEE